jgi:hypothetical protein
MQIRSNKPSATRDQYHVPGYMDWQHNREGPAHD